MSDEIKKIVEGVNANIESMKATSAEVQAELKKAVEANGADVAEAVKKANALAEKMEAQANTLLERFF